MGFIGALADALRDVGGAISSGVGVVKDAAQVYAATNAPPQLRKAVRVTTRALGAGLSALDVPYHQVATYTSAGLQFGQVAGEDLLRGNNPLENGWGYYFNHTMPTYWREAVKRAQDTSVGQSVIEGGVHAAALVTQDERSKELAFHRNRVHNRYKKSLAYHVGSGLLDFDARWFGDPLNFAGRGLSAARKALVYRPVKLGEDVSKAMEEAPRGLRRFDPGNLHVRTQNLIRRSTGWDAYQFFVGVDGLSESSAGMAVASALHKASQVKDPIQREQQMKLVLRTVYGDSSAVRELTQANAEIADQLSELALQRRYLEQASGAQAFSEGDQGVLLTDDAVPTLGFFDRPDVGEDFANRIQHIGQLQKRLISQQNFNHQLKELRLVQAQRSLNVTRRSAARAGRNGQSAPGAIRQDLIEDAPRWARSGMIRTSLWNVPMRVVTLPLRVADSALTMHAQGILNLESPDSVKTLAAMIDGARGFDPAAKARLLSRYINAVGEGEKQKVINAAERAVFEHIANRRGLDPDLAHKAVQMWAARRATFLGKLKGYVGMGASEAFSSAPSATRKGLPADSFIDEDGVLVRVPLLETHLRNGVPLLNPALVDHVARRQTARLKALGDQYDAFDNAYRRAMTKTARRLDALHWGAAEFTHDILNGFNRLWKFVVLARLGYAIRNVTDDSLRGWARVGAAMGQVQAEAAWDTARNVGRSAWSLVDRRAAKAAMGKDISWVQAAKVRLEHAEGKDPALAEQLRDGIAERQARIDEGYNAYRPEKIKLADGTYTLPNGQKLADAFGGGDADLRELESSASGVGSRIIHQGEDGLLSQAMLGGDWVDIEPGQPGHMAAWLDAVNLQIRQSKIAQKMLEGRTDRQVITWLKRDPEGRAIAKRMAHHASNKEAWVADVRSHLESYLPDPQWWPVALKRRLTKRDLDTYLAKGGQAPRVNGPALDYSLGRGPAARMVNNAMETVMHVLGDLPTTRLARHPFYVAVWRKTAKDTYDRILADPNRPAAFRDRLAPSELDRIGKIAHRAALAELKRTMFDISAHSNAAHAMRFVSPFMGAWQETLERWWNIAKDKPQLINYFNLAWQAPNKAGMVVDFEGNPVPESEGVTDDEFFVIGLPAWMAGRDAKHPNAGLLKIPGSKMMPFIPKSAFSIALQGDPWWLPGFGPMVQIPMGWFSKKMPQFDSVAKIVNPYGPPDSVLQALEPATLRRVDSLIRGASARDFGEATVNIYWQDYVAWEKAGEPGEWNSSRRLAEATDKAKWLYALRVANNALNPFPAQFQSPLKFYQDAYNNLQQTAVQQGRPRDWAERKFIEQYGETYFPVVQGLSQNNAGLPPTAEAMDAFYRNKALVQDYPDMLARILDFDDTGQFNQSAYRAQLTSTYAPGSSKTMRSFKDPKEAVDSAFVADGWEKFRRMTDSIDAYAGQEGLTSYSEDPRLVALRQQQVALLRAQNPAWSEAYVSASSADEFPDKIRELTQIANDRRLADNPLRTDIRTLQKYLRLRQAFQEWLSQQQYTTPGAAANQQAMQLYAQQVHMLVESDTKFSSKWFNGLLEFDPMLTAVEGQQ